MKIWQLQSPKMLAHVEVPDLICGERQAKAKITKALLSPTDVAVYLGTKKVKYPLTLGRFAVGQITESDETSFFKRGDRVYFSDVLEDELTESGLKTAGETADGYFCDFALVNEGNAFELPSSVSDEAAFFIDAVALAEHVIDECEIGVGQHVLVIGGGIYSTVLCQILIYHRAVPILLDNNLSHLEQAKKCGVYYTAQNDETAYETVKSITGGRLADAAVYLSFANKSDASSFLALVKNDARVCYCSRNPRALNVNLENAIKKNLTVKGITESREFIATAINALANKAVNFSEFPMETKKEEDLPQILEETSEETAIAKMTVLKFVF